MIKSTLVRYYLALLIILFLLRQIISQSMTDTLDGNFDISGMIATEYGFVPIPFLITEPALGFGAGAALVFIHRTPEEIAQMKRKTPSLSRVVGMYTTTKSWAVGGGHMGFWNDGAIRFRGGGGYFSLNLNFYPDYIYANADLSGVAGVLLFDHSLVAGSLAERIAGNMTHRAPGGTGHWSSGPVALAHGMLRTTPEAAADAQPLVDMQRGLILVMDGRLDNRDELYARLKPRFAKHGTPDSTYVLEAYARWADQCPGYLLGDFAFAVWDLKHRRFFCALEFSAAPGSAYVLETSADLRSWSGLQTNVAAGATASWSDATAPHPGQRFRIRF